MTETMVQKPKRADALDALRGLAILFMILSGTIPFSGPAALPAWMYHAQVPPPDHMFNPNLPGITWVDLVFPFFLFSMGAAFPFAMRKKIEKGMPYWKMSLQIIGRGLLLAGFAIFIQHIKPYALSPEPTALHWGIGLFGFLLMFPILLRIPFDIKPYLRWGIKIAGVAIAVVMMALLRYPNGSGFSLQRSDIIILVLANVALFGSLAWLFTKDNMLVRLGILGFLIAIRLTHEVDGSWNHWLWGYTPFPWLYTLYYLQYLFIVIPGSIVGDLIYKWIYEKHEGSETAGLNRSYYFMLMLLMFVFVVMNLIGLFSRQLVPNLSANILFILAGYLLLKKASNHLEKFYKSLFNWGVYWLLLGLAFEAFEGGIKKDHPTMSYYFVTSGLAIFTMIGFSVISDYFSKGKYLKLLIENGQNPMIAYIGGSNFVMPVLALTTLNSLLTYLLVNPWLGFLKGLILTLLVALLTSFFTRKKLFWRT